MADAPYGLRLWTPSDASAVRALLLRGFPGRAEANLVESLRRDGDAAIEVVAHDDSGDIQGHVLFSKMRAPFPALALAPLVVAPNRQGRGIGTALVREGLARAAGSGVWGVFVLGAPAYYQRFGFSAEAAVAFDSPYAGSHFMLARLREDQYPTPGHVEHAPAFAALA